jgi:hypothetical protein
VWFGLLGDYSSTPAHCLGLWSFEGSNPTVDHATFEKVVRKYLSQGKPAHTDTGYALGRPIAGPA